MNKIEQPNQHFIRDFFIKSRSSGLLSIVNLTSVIYIIVLAIAFSDLYIVMDRWIVATQAIGVTIILCNIFVLRKTKNIPLAAGIMLVCMFIIHMVNVTFAGGIDTVHYAWILIFPILAGGTMGWRGQVFFWCLCVIGTVCYYIWPEVNEVLPYEGNLNYTLGTRLMCITILSLIMLTYYFTLNEKMENLSDLARFDHLTQLPNRLMIQEKLLAMLETHHQSASTFAVIFIDLDKFKDVNDMNGHNAGDEVLKEAAKRLSEAANGGEFIGRFGGDEFILLSTGYQSLDVLIRRINQYQALLMTPIEYENTTHYIGSSVGVALFPEDGNEVNDLLTKADSAMYRAKSFSKGGFEFFSVQHDEAIKRQLQIRNELICAIENGEFSLVYQPIFASDASVLGAEALIRWNNPVLGQVTPDEFIPISEDNGLIGGIGEWVMNEACRVLKQWHDLGNTSLTMSINISYKQIVGIELVDMVKANLEQYQLNGNAIILELTERVFAEDLSLVQRNISLLAELGIDTAIDDFGIAYSSLSYLKDTDFKSVKIDRSFVSNIDSDTASRKLCTAIQSMAKSLGLSITAEGVETKEHLDVLRAINIDKYQGFYLSKPIENKEFISLLNK